MTEAQYDYVVTFVGSWFTLTSTVITISEDDPDLAIKGATELLHDMYGWDMDAVSDVAITAERMNKED